MILRRPIGLEELWRSEPIFFPDMMKFCLDRKREVVAINGEMHIDLEYELYDDGSEDRDIFGGNIMKSPVSVIWESHPNISRNKELGIGSGRLLTDQETIDGLFAILTKYIR